MDINQLFLFVIIGGIIQVSLQIYYIISCINNNKITNKQKNLWILIIIIFNILGAAFYLLLTREKSSDYLMVKSHEKIDVNVRHSILLFLIFAFEILSLDIITKTSNNLIIVLLSITLAILVIRHFFINKKSIVIYYVLPAIQIIFIIIVDFVADSNYNIFLLLVVIASLIIDYSLKISKIYGVISLIFLLISSSIKMISETENLIADDFVYMIMITSVMYILVFSMFYIIKKQIILNNRLHFLMYELKEKNQCLEEMSVIRERNRIAREIHDTLGHTLTGAIIQLEAAKKQVKIDKQLTIKTIEDTQNIVRSGFSDVKRAIKALRPIMVEENTLKDSLELLFERVQKDFDFTINYNIDLLSDIPNNIKVSVYRIVQELITNSKRHGNANSMQIDIIYQDNIIKIDTKDNGKGSKVIHEGYGLTGIRERVNSLSGNVYFNSQENMGFNTSISIPFNKN